MKIFAKCWGLLALCWSTVAFSESGKFDLFHFKRADGEMQPYVLYTPKALDANQSRPLIVYLHGAVSAPKLQIDPLGAAKCSPMVKLADEGGYYVLFPYGQKGLSWFEHAGVEMVLAEIDAVKQTVQIDPDKVFLSGFSDGGSGSFYFAATKSDPFAGFISLNGALPVAANIGESPVYLENVNQKPFYVVNTQSDMLYPARLMKPLMDYLLQYHPNMIFNTPEGNHDMRYFPSLQAEIKYFIEQHRRQTVTDISLESADDFSNQYSWLKITKRNEAESTKAWHKPYALRMVNDKASLGVGFDMKHQGLGLKVTGVKKDSVSANIGIQAGDVIIKLEETLLDSRNALFSYLGSKKAGDTTVITIQRDGQEMILKGNFPPAYDYEVFAKQPLSAKVKATLQDNQLMIETSRVSEFEIDFDQLPWAKDAKTLSLVINGKAQQVIPHNKQTFVVP
ncbi:MAG: PDZ domain-containing protein [Pasteurellaceae bacterium]|nr:PDZ domain-containing protein [Pasteurellaceae bacterium]